MPYTYKKEGNKFVVYKKKPDGTVGERVGATQGSEEALKKYFAALHINAMKKESKMVELVEQITRLVIRRLKEAKDEEPETEESEMEEPEIEEPEPPVKKEEPPKVKQKPSTPEEEEPEEEEPEEEEWGELTKDQSTLTSRFMTKMVETEDFSSQTVPLILQQIVNSIPNITKGMKINIINKLKELLFTKEG